MANTDDPSSEHGRRTREITPSIYLICIIASTVGLNVGYCVGISGGLTTMESFLKKFFPAVWEEEESSTTTNEYCQFNSEVLTAFTSSLYLAAMVASLVAGRVSRIYGRRFSMILGGLLFLVGTLIGTAALNVAMLIFGRLLLGLAIGFIQQATPVYLAEMAPPKWRGMISTFLPMSCTAGAVIANLINYWTSQIDSTWNWRLSLGLGTIPALIMSIDTFFLPESPSSLIERGMIDDARKTLEIVRGGNSGTTEIETELERILEEYKRSSKSSTKTQCRRLLMREYRPQLVMAMAVSVLSQLTGSSIGMMYAPVLFQSIGFGSDEALLGAAGLAGFSLICYFVSLLVVDRFGRKVLFVEGGIQMIIFQAGIAWVLGATYGETISKGDSILILLFIFMYSAGNTWSWGALQPLITSEIFPLEIRSVGQSTATAVNYAVTFLMAQFLVSMLCAMKYMIFIFFMVCNILILVFLVALLPETKGLALEDMHVVWEKHWFWRWFAVQVVDEDLASLEVPLTS